MAVQDPRTLIIILNDLVEELRRWKMVVRDTLRDMSWHQKQREEKVIQAQYHGAIVRDQCEKDRQDVDYAKSQVEELLLKCYHAQENAKKSHFEAQQARDRAKSTLFHWQEQLEQARAWLRRAESQLREAILEREAAENSLDIAQNSLESAQLALSRCENSGYRDKDDVYHAPNCSSQERAVSNAKDDVAQAKGRLSAAIDQERTARQEVERAKARVNCCQNAVGYGQQAVSSANTTLNHANDAVSFAERSLENVQAATRMLEQAQREVISQQEMVDLMSFAVSTAENLTNESRRNFQGAQESSNSAQRLENAVSKELEQRVEYLIELNQPFEF